MKRAAGFVFCLLCVLPRLFAQEPPFAVTVYKRDTAFTCIAADKNGNIYAGTNGRGLWKFDQRVWKNWSGLSPAFTRSFLRQIAVSEKDIWVASSGYVLYNGSPDAGNNMNFWGGMHQIDQKLPLKRVYYRGRPVLGQLNRQGPPTRNVLGVHIDSAGRPWCAASYQDSMTYVASLNYNGRYHFAPGAVGRFNTVNFDFVTGPDLPNPEGILIGVGNNYRDENYSSGKRRTCRSIAQVGQEMWVGSDGYSASQVVTAGILRYTLAGDYIGKYDQNNTPVPFGAGTTDFGPWGLYGDGKGRGWAAMNGNKGFAVFDSTGWHHIGVPSVLPANTIFRANGITGNQNGEVFFATSSGLLVYDGRGAYTNPGSYKLYTTANGLSSNSIVGVAISKDQTIWAATSAGVNKIERGDLFVYNRKPYYKIYTDVPELRTAVLRYDSRSTQEKIDRDTLLISADGGKATIFKWTGSALANAEFRVAEDPKGEETKEFGSFAVHFRSADSLRVLFNHPAFLPEEYAIGNGVGRTVHIEVVDTHAEPEKVLIRIPVRFVLPPVLMAHGVWSSIKSFEKMENALAALPAYKPYRLLRIWFPNDRHREPAASQEYYSYVITSGINSLVDNCARNKMSVGKVDILAHSRAGIFSRIYLQGRYMQYNNDINKLITINTPHSGSQQANLLLDKRGIPLTIPTTVPGFYKRDTIKLGKIFEFFALESYDDLNGAEELKVNAPAIIENLNGPSQLNRNTTYAHAIIGRYQFGSDKLALVIAGNLVKGRLSLALRLITALLGVGEMTANELLKAIFNGEENDIVVPESSQQGGLDENHVSRFPGLKVAHSDKSILFVPVIKGVLNIPEVHTRIAALLRAKPTGGLFATNGFHPPNLSQAYRFLQPNPFYLVGTPEAGYRMAGGDVTVKIDSSLRGRQFAAGDTVTITVSKANTDTLVTAYTGSSIDAYSDVATGNESVFRFPIPKEAAGPILIGVYGFNNYRMAYDSVTIFASIPTGVTLDSIRIVKNESNELQQIFKGDSLDYQLNGYYSDGVVRDISSLLPRRHVVEGGNVSVDMPNRIKGINIGYDLLMVTVDGRSDSLNIEVVPPVVIVSPTVLPVRFGTIKATRQDAKIVVAWQTAQEINNDHFVVEHSVDGMQFSKAGTVPASNKAAGDRYSFDHLHPVAGKNYYRIKQVDLDGKGSYSSTVVVTIAPDNRMTLFPNPVSGLLTIRFEDRPQLLRTFRIVNAAGQVVFQRQPAGSLNQMEVRTGHWPPGVYVAELAPKQGKPYAVAFIKN